MINSALEPVNCTVFGNFKWDLKYFSTLVFFKFIFFPVAMSVVLFSRLYMSCALFFFYSLDIFGLKMV